LEILPPENLTFLIGGTNGKGTTLALIEDILIQKGLKVGGYTSPHLNNYNERICVNKKPVDDSRLIESFKLVESVRKDIPLTYFEFGTLAAFIILNDLNCEAWLIEVGLGGRLDATNIISPSISIITNIALDHQEWLGSTLEEIAKEKAGIISAKIPCIFGDPSLPKNIEQTALEKGSDLYVLGRDFSLSGYWGRLVWQGKDAAINSIRIPSHWAEGEIDDLCLALMAIEIVDSELLPTTKELNHLLNNFSVSGRFEIIEKKQTWILDVAHNPHAAENLRKRLESLDPYKKITAILSLMQDKDIIGFVKVLDDLVAHWIVCEMDTPRSHSVQTLQKKLIDYGISNVTSASGLLEAFSNVKNHTKKNDRILITGSFEIVGPAKKWLDSE
jgi:dihydrofolate synthase/folylpolyglutamate synthase